jgi:peptidoglycan glycosyltransferase
VNRQITRLAVFGVVMIAALIVATTYWQTWAAAGLADRQDNAIKRVAQFTIDRGVIYAGDGRTVLAENVKRKIKGKTYYFRRYPQRGLAAHVVGYSTQARSRAGLERSANDYLTGSNAHLSTVVDTFRDRLTGATIHGNDIVTSLDLRGQRAAMNALGRRCGAVVALEPRTGRVLVMVSSPTYNPNEVESRGGWARINNARADCAPAAALVNRAADGLYAPGSTFKVVTMAAALESGRWNLDSDFFDPGYCEEYGKRVQNYDTSRPFGTISLLIALQHSVNSVFCNIGKELGGLRILAEAKQMGFYSKPPLELPTNERQASGLYNRRGELFEPKDPNAVDPGRLAFGQERLLVSPLQMAMVTAMVANDGVVMEPHIIDRVIAPDGKELVATEPDALGRSISRENAEALAQAMEAVVSGGTGRAAAISGVRVAGKTGTAETGRAGVNTVAFLGFAPVEQPRVAIAVFVESQRSTGGETAAPIAREVMQALLGRASNS